MNIIGHIPVCFLKRTIEMFSLDNIRKKVKEYEDSSENQRKQLEEHIPEYEEVVASFIKEKTYAGYVVPLNKNRIYMEFLAAEIEKLGEGVKADFIADTNGQYEKLLVSGLDNLEISEKDTEFKKLRQQSRESGEEDEKKK